MTYSKRSDRVRAQLAVRIRSSGTYAVCCIMEQMTDRIDFLIPAHNEESTVGSVVEACCEAATSLQLYDATVTVVADHCIDQTAEFAESAGADVIERNTGTPSKAHAVQVGISATEGSVVALFDADCVGLTPTHIATLVEPVAANRAAQSVGVLDYAHVAGLVQRYPWSSGQRVLRRALVDWSDLRFEGYCLEVLINEYVGAQSGLTESVRLRGVAHRNKIAKDGLAEGIRSDIAMWRSVASLVMAACDHSSLERYLQGVVLSESTGRRQVSPLEARLGFLGLREICRLLAK